jgi:formimidoylglutamate deiminase
LGSSGARSVAWLLDHAAIDGQWCLVHATHTDERELSGIARCGASVGLCLVTEANLGDGIFDAVAFPAAGGGFSIGSYSNAEIGVAAEFWQLEYSQRLARRERTVLAGEGQSTGRALFEKAVRGGSQALEIRCPGLAVGASADFVTLGGHPAFVADRDRWLDSWIFAAGNRMVDCVFVRGEKVVEAGRHRARDAIARRCRAVAERLAD